MVVNPTKNGWECIFQRAHAWMSYLMLIDFQSPLKVADWPAILQATLTHDHGWMEWKEALLDDDGQPASFVVSGVEKAIKISTRGIELAAFQSLESAVYVARHIEELYGWREEEQLQAHVAEIRGRRLGWMRSLEMDEELVEAGYQRVLWADSASLILCVADQDFVSELALKMDGTDYRLKRTNDHWKLDPWPYQEDELQVTVETRLLNQKRFSSPQELQAALKAAPHGFKRWKIRP